MVLSMKVGRMPRCSITGMAHIGAATLAVQMPSISRMDRPASATALRRLHQDFHFGIALGLPQAGVAHAGHGHRASQIVQFHVASCCGANTSRPWPFSDAIRARTDMPMRTASGGTPSTRLISRTPSFRSTSATL